MVTTRPPKTIVKPTALGPVANTDTKLLIYGLFQKGRVLAQDGVEVDRDKLGAVLEQWRDVQKQTQASGVSFGEAMRMLAGAELDGDDSNGTEDARQEWSEVIAGKWLSSRLDALRSPGYCQVDEKLADRPPRYWARARREPAMLGIRNGCQPQLDNTVRSFGCGNSTTSSRAGT